MTKRFAHATALLVALTILAVAWPVKSTAQAQPAPAPYSCSGGAADASQSNIFKGSGTATLGPVDLNAGLVVFCGKSNGNGNFSVSLATPDSPGADPANSYSNRYLMVDAVGAYNGQSAVMLKQPGSYYFIVGLASGPYEMSVSQPTPDSAGTPAAQNSFSGRGQQVMAPFSLPAGSYTVSVQSDNSSVRVWLYAIDDLGGSAVTTDLVPQFDGRLIDTTQPPGYTSVPITLSSDGVYILYVDAEGTGSGNWTVTIQ